MRVKYWWSEDGEVEYCNSEIIVNTEEIRCGHCDTVIPAKSEAVKLTTLDGEERLLHKDCAAKSCEEDKRTLESFGISYHEKMFEMNFWRMAAAVENGEECLEQYQYDLISDVHAACAMGLMSIEQGRFIEDNFIYSDEGFRNTNKCQKTR